MLLKNKGYIISNYLENWKKHIKKNNIIQLLNIILAIYLYIRFKKATLELIINKNKSNNILLKLFGINILANKVLNIFYLGVNYYKISNIILLNKPEI